MHVKFLIISFKDTGVYGSLSSVKELGIDFFVFDTDVMSLEWTDSFKVRLLVFILGDLILSQNFTL